MLSEEIKAQLSLLSCLCSTGSGTMISLLICGVTTLQRMCRRSHHRSAGVKDRITNALGSHSRFVERAIANARKVLYLAEVVGDAMCDRDLRLMMTYGDIDMNPVKATCHESIFSPQSID